MIGAFDQKLAEVSIAGLCDGQRRQPPTAMKKERESVPCIASSSLRCRVVGIEAAFKEWKAPPLRRRTLRPIACE
jgi:hypothetical protein